MISGEALYLNMLICYNIIINYVTIMKCTVRRVLQGCYKGASSPDKPYNGGTKVKQKCYTGVTRVLQKCYGSVTELL
jgi:hypothetical protein